MPPGHVAYLVSTNALAQLTSGDRHAVPSLLLYVPPAQTLQSVATMPPVAARMVSKRHSVGAPEPMGQ